MGFLRSKDRTSNGQKGHKDSVAARSGLYVIMKSEQCDFSADDTVVSKGGGQLLEMLYVCG